MRRLAASAAVIVLSLWAVAHAQTGPAASSADGGVARPALEDGGSVLRPFSAAPDGGVAAPRGTSAAATAPGGPPIEHRNGVEYVGTGRISAAEPDAGTAESGGGFDGGGSSQSAAETADLRRRISLLEQQVSATREQSQKLDELNQQVSQLRDQLAQVESQRVQAEQDALTSRNQATQAVNSLYSVQQALASGNYDVGGTIASLASSLPPVAQRELEAARAALSAEDLSAARSHIAAAIAATPH